MQIRGLRSAIRRTARSALLQARSVVGGRHSSNGRMLGCLRSLVLDSSHRMHLCEPSGFSRGLATKASKEPPREYAPPLAPTMSVAEFRDAFRSQAEAGSRLEQHDGIVLCGRISGRRDASSKLIFLDLEGGVELRTSAGDEYGRGEGERLFREDGNEDTDSQRGAEGSSIASHASVRGSPRTRLEEARVQVLAERQFYRPRVTSATMKQELKGLRRGDWVAVEGFPGASGRGELSIVPRQVRLLAPVARPAGLPPAGSIESLETRARERSLALASDGPQGRAPFVKRAAMVSQLRRSLEARGFLEVETPILQAQAGGASATPFETHAAALSGPASMRIAPELYLKMLVAGGMGRVFELGKVFRNEGMDATHHPEFTTAELYAPHCSVQELAVMTRELMADAAVSVRGSPSAVIEVTVPAEWLVGAHRVYGTVARSGVAEEDSTPSSSSLAISGGYDPATLLGNPLLAPAVRLTPETMELAGAMGEAGTTREGGSGDGSGAVHAGEDERVTVEVEVRFDAGEFPQVDIAPALETHVRQRLAAIEGDGFDSGITDRLVPDPSSPGAGAALTTLLDRLDIPAPSPSTPSRCYDSLIAHFLEPRCVGPTLLVGHPLAMSPLARRREETADSTEEGGVGESARDPYPVADRFELFVGGVELANAYQELNDPVEQRARFEAQAGDRAAGDAEAQPMDESFCRALEVGMPPTAGWGLGVDRLAMMLTGTRSIREMLLFPMLRPEGAEAEMERPDDGEGGAGIQVKRS